MVRSALTTVGLGLLIGGWASLSAATFEDAVQPILTERCAGCHGAQVQMAGLGLHDLASILKGSDNGPVILPGAPGESVLMQRVEAGTMPPGDGPKLDAAQLGAIRAWIAEASSEPVASKASEASEYVSSITGEDRRFWAFRRIERPEPPTSAERQAALIDAFLLEKLEEKGLSFSPEASRTRLIRRATLDLTGLPPTQAEVEAFERDSSPDAYQRLVDRLLASPQFGERWGRHWLDVAGYVDTVGRDVQANGYRIGPGRWRYRDYVVAALNDDKPFDRFIQEQLAGDELVQWRNATSYDAETLTALTATGYLRTVEDPTDADERDTPLLRYSVLHQTIEIVTSGITGLTVACARCHTHKFDPIPQRDYYRLMAVLATAYNPDKWIQPQDRFLADTPPSEQAKIDAHNQTVDSAVKPLSDQRKVLLARGEETHTAALIAAFPAGKQAEIEAAVCIPQKKRSASQRALVKKAKLDKIETAAAVAALAPEDRVRYEELSGQIAELEAEKRTYNKLEAIFDVGPAPVIHVHRRGDHESPGDIAPPGGLSVLEDPGDLGAEMEPPSSRRLALARWLTDKDTRAGALVARVAVNRIWAHLFGEGIVSTLDNFGVMGARPTHPELLEWLASELQQNGWRFKPLIRQVVLSQAYRQDSTRVGHEDVAAGANPVEIDPDNTLLWRMRARRLESEVIRDSMLAVSGKLNHAVGGPPIPTLVQSDGMVVLDESRLPAPEARYRRSLYLVARRRFNLSMLEVFDHPVMSTNATHRNSSAVVLQSLMMLNDAEVNEQATFFAQRVAQLAGDEPEDQIAMAFRMSFGRPPVEDELDWAEAFYRRELARYQPTASGQPGSPTVAALASVCHVLFNGNEFLYVE